MTDTDLLQRVCDTVHGYLEVGNDVFQATGATFVRNRACATRYDANHIARVRCETEREIAALFERVEAEFVGYGHRRFDVDPFTAAPFVARIVMEEYVCSETVQLVLEGELNARVRPAELRPVEGELAWTAFAGLTDLWWRERAERERFTYRAESVAGFVVARRYQTPAVRHWLAYIDDVACAYGSSWPGRSGVGIVEDLFTHPQYRHRGLATAVIAHAVAEVRRDGAREVVIGAYTDDTPKHMYAAIGFRPLLLTRQYLRIVKGS